MSEKWKDIAGYEGVYSISSFGNVYSVKRKRTLSLETTSLGYKRVTLYSNGKPKHFSVHRLVAQVFIPNTYHYPCVNHKDENPSNNRIENLEWCTYSYNINYGTRNLKLSKKSKPVKQITFEGFVVATYYSVEFASKMLGVDSSNIYKCCRGEISYAHDYKWEYV